MQAVVPLLPKRTDYFPPRFAFNRPYIVHLMGLTKTIPEDHFSIFTDGSKTPKEAGSGIFSKHLRVHEKWAVDRHWNNIATEFGDITMATEEISRQAMTGTTSISYTDCKKSLTTIEKYKITEWSDWRCYFSPPVNRIVVGWIEGHTRCTYNNTVLINWQERRRTKLCRSQPFYTYIATYSKNRKR